jgi:hypothetical protein
VRVTPQINIALPLDLQVAAREALGLPESVKVAVLARAVFAKVAGVEPPPLRPGRRPGYSPGKRTVSVELPDV